MNDMTFRVGLVFALILAVVIVILVAMPAVSGSQIAPMWTPRPTGLPTREAFLPLVERGGPATATPIPRPTIGAMERDARPTGPKR